MSADTLALVEEVFGPCVDVSETEEGQRWCREIAEVEAGDRRHRAAVRRNRRGRVSESENVERLVKAAEALYEWAERKMPERIDKKGWTELREALDTVIDEGLAALSDPGVDGLGASHAGGSDTEKRAAWANYPASGSQRLRVLEEIAWAHDDGCTDYELEQTLDSKRPSPGNRRGELVVGGWVVDSGRRRPTDTGNEAIVWVLTAAGRKAFDEERSVGS